MFSYNETENDRNLVLDYSGAGGSGASHGNGGDFNGFFKRAFAFIVVAVSMAITGILCIVLGRSEPMISVGFTIFACIIPVGMFAQFLFNKFADLLERWRRSVREKRDGRFDKDRVLW